FSSALDSEQEANIPAVNIAMPPMILNCLSFILCCICFVVKIFSVFSDEFTRSPRSFSQSSRSFVLSAQRFQSQVQIQTQVHSSGSSDTFFTFDLLITDA